MEEKIDKSFIWFALFFVGLALSGYQGFQIYQLWDKGITKEGKVVSSYSLFGKNEGCRDNRYGNAMECKIIYVDVGNVNVAAEVSVAGKYDLGETLKITYLPRNYKKNTLYTFDYKANRILQFFVGVFLSAIAIYLFKRNLDKEIANA
ncbi:MAG: hypothetical protein H6995_06005 [Pseudomonadales bacterium]|nr:hypothetical protein [Pseudomonadales bacterium]